MSSEQLVVCNWQELANCGVPDYKQADAGKEQLLTAQLRIANCLDGEPTFDI